MWHARGPLGQRAPRVFRIMPETFVPSTHLLDAFGGHIVNNLRGHVEVLGGYVSQGDAVLGQELGQGVDCATVFQVPNHGDLQDGRE